MGDDVIVVEGGGCPDEDGPPGPVQRAIHQKLTELLNASDLEIVNESFKHMGGCVGKETHFRISLVSEKFSGLKPLDRHRLVNQTLKEELAGSLHALSIDARAPKRDWSKK